MTIVDVSTRTSKPNVIYAICILGLIAALGFASATSVKAQAEDTYRTPERKFIDPLGISSLEADYVRNDTLLSIGDPAQGGLAWTYHGHDPSLSGAYSGYIDVNYTLKETFVVIGETAIAFVGQNPPYVNGIGTSSTLVGNVYTSEDGTVYTFTGGSLSSILQPNGVLTTLNTGTCASGTCSSATTNTGFAFKFDSTAGVVSAVNMLAHSCDAKALNCDSYDNYITRTDSFTDPDFTGLGGKHQFTDSLGNAWRYLVYFTYVIRNPRDPLDVQRGPPTVFVFKDPTGYLAKIPHDKNTGDVTSFTDPRGTFTYSSNNGTNIYDPSGALIYSAISIPVGTTQQLSFKDGLNRQTTYNIAGHYTSVDPLNGYQSGYYTRVTSVVKPEGNALSYVYDARGNVTQTTSTPKPGMGSPLVVYSASYPSTCTNLKICNKPTWTKDANGGQTDYTYDATHGGLLTVTLPANAAGLRLRTYKTYTAYNTGNGNIYRLTRSETCGLTSAQLTLTACPAAITTSVTLIDYGISTTAPYTYKSFQPYQVTQRDNRASGYDSQTTTYAYDKIGNVVSVDGPLAGTVDQSFTTYDANRRKIFEIGPIPGGAGTQKRSLVRHTYDGAGRETQTAVGYANSNATNGSDAVYTSYSRMTYDAAGRLGKTEAISKDVVVP